MKIVYCQTGINLGMHKTRIALYFFGLVSILDLLGILFEVPLFIHTFKPLIIISLVILYVFSVKNRNKTYIVALFFSFLGDSLLMYEGQFYFISGLLSFLSAHILFILIVLKGLNKPSKLNWFQAASPFILYLILLIFLLKDDLKSMLIPVVIYAITIGFFGIFTFVDYLQKRTIQSKTMLIGAVLFIISDSILAIQKFHTSNELFPFLIMFTYIFAQYLIYKALVLKDVKTKY